jgi:quinol monooxygenase YgiN
MSVPYVVVFKAVDGKGDDLASLLQQGRDIYATIAECETCDVYRSEEDPNRVALVERWTSVEAHDSSLEKLQSAGIFQQIVPILAEPFIGGPHRQI